MNKLVTLLVSATILSGCAGISPEQQYYRAIQNNDIQAMQALENAGYRTTLPQGDIQTPLHTAVALGKPEAISFLVAQGYQLNRQYQGNTPLINAVIRGDEAVIRQLIAAGADVNYTPEQSGPAISRLKERDAALAPLLVDNQTNLKAVKSQLSPKRNPKVYAYLDQQDQARQQLLKQLTVALQHDDSQAVADYLAAGYSANAEIGNDTYVLERAVSYNAIRSLDTLLQAPGILPDQANSKGITPLHKAAFLNRDKMITLLLEHGANPAVLTIPQPDPTMHGTPLMVAARSGRINAIRALLAGGADANQFDRWGRATIHLINSRERATLRDYTPVIQALAVGGADLNLRSEKGETALTLALHTDASKEVIDTLIEYGADVNLSDQNNIPPLHIAVRNRKPAQVQQLVNAGANLETKNGEQQLTPLLQVTVFDDYLPQDSEIAEILLKAGADKEARSIQEMTALMFTSKRNKRSLTRLLLASGADPDARGQDAYTALHYASEQGNLEVAELLLSANPRPDQRIAGSGLTALHIAARDNNIALVELLLNNGHSPMIADSEGKTPLHAALENFTSKASGEVVQRLIDKGASVNALTNRGITPLMLACITGKFDAVTRLVNAGAIIETANPVDPAHYTASDYAEMNNQLEILAFLTTQTTK